MGGFAKVPSSVTTADVVETRIGALPWAGSQTHPGPAAIANQDGTTFHPAPERPDDAAEGAWMQTAPGKGWFAVLRLHSPEQPFFGTSWRPGEVAPAD